ncbi:uncharacterized protein AMSG_03080 [Thecamonas trahens ATCC 50062]|uniref:Centromere protein L n=1 Tax=Thecamonas trahens ATCC 50062 TaxID=461836 RepID=A0A0L0D5R6_THETB|nr:hypothetical protein AMSG_03080 [Thecamonas trahens ATCC 50062]KNC46643.1 hypothetical protein AMSG_03080 [Thecamonas trahens ATCC 50062]|eukprot:XP_013760416.1 hypothetical protein AMSG_03080 [Thecamonas trahens ATCC 50062]
MLRPLPGLGSSPVGGGRAGSGRTGSGRGAAGSSAAGSSAAGSSAGQASLGLLPANATFRAYRTTPLYGLRVTSDAFSTYSKALVEHMRAEEHRVSGASPYRVYHVVVTSPTTAGDDVLHISVHYRRHYDDAAAAAAAAAGRATRRRGDDTSPLAGLDEAKGVLTVYLIGSRDSSGRKSDATNAQFVHLPLLLTKGPLSMARDVINWIETSFDATVAPLELPSYALTSLLHVWMRKVVTTDPARFAPPRRGRPRAAATGAREPTSPKRPLELVFAVLDAAPGLDTITYTIEYDSVMSLYRASRAALFPTPRSPRRGETGLSADDEASLAAAVVDGIFTQFEAVFGLALSRVVLKQISTPIAMITAGKLKLLLPGAEIASFVVNSLHSFVMPRGAAD